MRTKALILSAMVGVAGIASSFAQNVYSVNVVGYINLTLTNTYSLVANQLDNGAGNLVTNMFAGVPSGTIVYKFNPATGTYTQLTFVNTAVGWTPPANRQMSLAPGEGVFVKKATGVAQISLTFVGEVMQGQLVNPVVVGYDIYSAMVPQQGGIVSVHGYAPSNGDIVYKFNGAAYTPKTWLGAPLNRWTPAPNVEPSLDVGEAVFIKATAAQNWTRTFSVN